MIQEDILIIEKERTEYNTTHNKNLSYGQYVGMLYAQELIKKRLKKLERARKKNKTKKA